MQVTIDIPEPLYREVEAEAAVNQLAIDAVVLRRIHDAPLPPVARTQGIPLTFPVIDHCEVTPFLARNRTDLNDAAFMTREEFDDFVSS